MATRAFLPRPSRSKHYRIMLTPLADVMFLLLIFFMLSSSLTPYSLLPIRGGAGGERQSAGGQAQAPQGPAIAADIAIWSVSAGEIVVGGQRFDLEALPQLAEALTANQTARVVVIARADAKVQDLASVLEALSGAGIAEVQLAGAPQR